jgi:hypothetical protein
MNKFLQRRLIIIKSLILLNLADELKKQIKSLKKFKTKEDISYIISLLDEGKYESVITEIDKKIITNGKSDLFEDTTIKTLNYYLKLLRKKLLKTRKRRENIERKLLDFGLLYNLEVGGIIERILYLRRELLKYELDQDPENDELKDEYNDAFEDFEKYHAEIEEMKKKNLLNDNELKDLKSKFRKATKLCHPDMVDESMKETAEQIFTQLKSAYENNDLKEVSRILELLETQDILLPKSENISDKDKLVAEIKKNLFEIKQEEDNITRLLQSETYKLIKNTKDINEYIKNTKKQMQIELESLEEIYKEKELFYSKRW